MRKLLDNDTRSKIIELYQSGLGSDTIAKQFAIHPNTILKVLKKAGIATRPFKRKIAVNDEQTISKLYQEGLSMQAIADKFGVTSAVIFRYLKKNNIQSRTAEECHRKYAIREDYFDNIDTQEKAYILGFLYADGGNVQKSNFTGIHLNEKDIDILYKISDKIYIENSKDRVKIFNRTRLHKGELKTFTHCGLTFNSKYICNQLTKLGCGPKKSLTLTFPEWLTDPDLQRHFIRGYYDGDGGVRFQTTGGSSSQARIISSAQFSNKLSEMIFNILHITPYNTYHNHNMIRITISGNRQVKTFLDWIYKDAIIYLNRKYKLYQELVAKSKK